MSITDNLRIILTEDGGTLAGLPELPTEETVDKLIAGLPI